ncbi:MAG: DMT family protein [Streptosporangiaceae bacterium]
MLVSLLAALLAAFCYGLGAVMQAIAVRASSRRPLLATAGAGGAAGRVDPGMFIRLLRQWPFLASLVIDMIGFIGQLVALRRLPLFEVQAIIAANLAVTAVFASWLMHAVLRWREWAAVIAVVIGIGLLGSSAGAEGAAKVGVDFHLGLLAALAAIAVAGVAAARLPNPIRTPALGAFAGLGYGVLAVCARILPGFSVHQLIRSPAAYTLVAAAIVSFMLYASALESGSVTTATASMILLETIPPAVVGVMLLGDSTRPGMTWLAVAGFLIALISAVALARFGEGASEETAGPAGPARTRAVESRATDARVTDAGAGGARTGADRGTDDDPTAPQSAVPGGHRAAGNSGRDEAGPEQVLASGQRRQQPR